MFRNGSDTPQATEGIEVSQANRVVGVTEEGSEDEGAYTWQGGKDGGVGGSFEFGSVLVVLEPFFEVLI